MFRKYPSLINLHNIPDEMLDLNQDVAVTEKIDGSNFSIVLDKEGIRIASRNQLVSDDWHNIDQLIDWERINAIHAMYDYYDINLYGEVFSSKILKRIPYGNTQIAFFACSVNDNMLSTCEFDKLLLPSVPSSVMRLRDAIEIDVENLESKYASGYNAEGIVIKSMYHDAIHPKVYAIKKKAERFLETAKEPKVLKDIPSYVSEFITYLNQNRVLSYISKVGEPTDKSQMGEYIKGIGQDAIDEYLSTLSEEDKMLLDITLLKKQVGKIIAPFVMNRIMLNKLGVNNAT